MTRSRTFLFGESLLSGKSTQMTAKTLQDVSLIEELLKHNSLVEFGYGIELDIDHPEYEELEKRFKES